MDKEHFLELIYRTGESVKKKNLLTGMTMVNSVIHCVLVCTGLLLNGFITYVIIRVKELRNQTRHVLFLGIIIGNICIFIGLLNEVAYFVAPSENICKFYSFFLGLPYIIFGTNYLLALIDNYVSIKWPVQYKDCFTLRNVIPCQIVFNILFCVAKFFFVFRPTEPNLCEPSIEIGMIGNSVLFILVSACTVLKMLIFKETKAFYVRRRNRRPSRGSVIDSQSTGTENAGGEAERKELLTLMFSVLTLLIIYIPRFLFALSSFVCSHLYPLDKEQCAFIEARPFMAEYTALHGIIQPIVYLCLCDQFWTAWKNRPYF